MPAHIAVMRPPYNSVTCATNALVVSGTIDAPMIKAKQPVKINSFAMVKTHSLRCFVGLSVYLLAFLSLLVVV
jgi:hypothetical protein